MANKRKRPLDTRAIEQFAQDQQEENFVQLPISKPERLTNSIFKLLQSKAPRQGKKKGEQQEAEVLDATEEEKTKKTEQASFNALALKYGRIKAWSKEKIKTSKGTIETLKTHIEQDEDSGKISLTVEFKDNKGTEIAFNFADVITLMKTCEPAKKLFKFILSRLDSRAIKQQQVIFSLQDLVNNGWYKDLNSARRGYLQGRKALASYSVLGKRYDYKGAEKAVLSFKTEAGDFTEGKERKAPNYDDFQVLFIGGRIRNNVCTIEVNPFVKWEIITQQYSIAPPWHFALGGKAFDLIDTIFSLARQDSELESLYTTFIQDLKDKEGTDEAPQGSFNISLRTLQSWLALPSEEGNRDVFNTIKLPIRNALNKIDEQIRLNGDFEDLYIEQCFDIKYPTKKYLDEGYIKVYLGGRYLAKFLSTYSEISGRTLEHIKRATAKKKKQEAKNKGEGA